MSAYTDFVASEQRYQRNDLSPCCSKCLLDADAWLLSYRAMIFPEAIGDDPF
jgi:hypothetical protein